MRRTLLSTLAVLLVGLLGVVGFQQIPPGPVSELAVRFERGAAGLERRTLESLGHDIVFLDGGVPSGETVLLVHGFAADKDSWPRFARHLAAAGYRVVAPDLPGHGESSRVESFTYDIPNQVAFVEDFCAQLGLERVHIVGSSMGGQIAAGYAATHPEQVASLGLFDAGGVTPPVKSERRRLEEQTGRNTLLLESVEDFDRLLELLFVQPPRMPSFVKRHLAEQAVGRRAMNRRILEDFTGRGRMMPLEPLLPSIAAPSLVLWGGADRVLDPSSVGVFEAGLRRSTTVMVKDCGHLPMIERPRETAEHYLAFLASAER